MHPPDFALDNGGDEIKKANCLHSIIEFVCSTIKNKY